MRTFALLLGLCAGLPFAAFAQHPYDLLVYGGTAGGVITAVSGAREGLKVALLEPGSHLGGMATGGLSRTDFGKKRQSAATPWNSTGESDRNMISPVLLSRSPGITNHTSAKKFCSLCCARQRSRS